MYWRALAWKIYEIPKEMKTDFKHLNDFLDELTNSFLKEVDQLDEKCIKELKKSKGDPVISSKKDLTDALKAEIVRFNGLLKSSHPYTSKIEGEIRDYFFDKNGRCKHKEFTSCIESSHNMYRMRKADTYTRYPRKGVYLLNSDLYNLAGAARFNHSGQSCLYTSDSLYTAWEELRRPDFHKANFVRIQPARRICVLDFTIPACPNSLFMLMRAYMCLVVSAKVVADTDLHHWQYVFPQLMIKILSEVLRTTSTSIVGIKYLSSRRFECEDYNINTTTKSSVYVFPSKDIGTDGYCKELAKTFKMTEALSYFFLKLHRQRFTPVSEPFVSDYQNTLFAELESILRAMPTILCSKIKLKEK